MSKLSYEMIKSLHIITLSSDFLKRDIVELLRLQNSNEAVEDKLSHQDKKDKVLTYLQELEGSLPILKSELAKI